MPLDSPARSVNPVIPGIGVTNRATAAHVDYRTNDVLGIRTEDVVVAARIGRAVVSDHKIIGADGDNPDSVAIGRAAVGIDRVAGAVDIDAGIAAGVALVIALAGIADEVAIIVGNDAAGRIRTGSAAADGAAVMDKDAIVSVTSSGAVNNCATVVRRNPVAVVDRF